MTVEVTEEDRVTAADIARTVHNPLWAEDIADSIIHGARDNTDLVQFTATHRLATERAVREDCAKVAERWYCEVFATEHENRCFTDIAAVIRAGSTGDKG